MPTPSHGLKSGMEVPKEGGRAQMSPDNGTMRSEFRGCGQKTSSESTAACARVENGNGAEAPAQSDPGPKSL